MLAYPETIAEEVARGQEVLNERFCRAMSARDVEGAMSCFLGSADLVVVLWGTVVRGGDALRKTFAQLFDGHPYVRLDVSECSYVPAGDGIIAVGTATYTLRDRAGVEQRIVERWTDLRRQIGGKWVYVLDHASIVQE